MPTPFDTQKAVEDMEADGVDRDLARTTVKTMAAALAAGRTADRDGLVTKTELAELKTDLIERMQAGERRLYAAVLVAAGLVVAVLKLIL